MDPSLILPGMAANMSQMLDPLPSVAFAPSICSERQRTVGEVSRSWVRVIAQTEASREILIISGLCAAQPQVGALSLQTCQQMKGIPGIAVPREVQSDMSFT